MSDQAARLRALVAAAPIPTGGETQRVAGLERPALFTVLVVGARPQAGCSTIAEGLAAGLDGADCRVIDAGAGRDAIEVAAALGADLVCVVTTPDVPAVLAAYASCKAIARAGLVARVGIVVNRTRSLAEATTVAGRVVGVARRFLGVSVDALGHVPTDRTLQRDDATVALPAPVSRGPAARAFAELIRACGVPHRAERRPPPIDRIANEEGT